MRPASPASPASLRAVLTGCQLGRPAPAGNLTIIGPYNLTQGGIGIVGMQAIFVPGTRNNTFNIPPGGNGKDSAVCLAAYAVLQRCGCH